jgi:hypothetical protein
MAARCLISCVDRRVIDPRGEGAWQKENPMSTMQLLYLILVLVAFGAFAAVLAVNSLRD